MDNGERTMDKLIVGCGYLGRRVAARWLAQGHRVFGTTRGGERAEDLRGLGIVPVVCDVLNVGGLRDLPPAETVLYCVGFDRAAGRSMREVYVEGLRNFFDSGAAAGARRLIHVSSTGVYGQCGGEEVDETSLTEPLEESGRVVLEAEKQVIGPDTRNLILRFAGIYGPGRVIRRQAVAKGEPLIGDAEKWLNLIHVEDGATAVLAAEERGKPGAIYNVSDGCPVRRRDFYTCLAALLGVPEPRFVPLAPGEPSPPHERGNRRIVNRRMREELGVRPCYSDYREGLPASL